MILLTFITLAILRTCSWIIEGERSTHNEINELISLIDRLEQEQALLNNLQAAKTTKYAKMTMPTMAQPQSA